MNKRITKLMLVICLIALSGCAVPQRAAQPAAPAAPAAPTAEAPKAAEPTAAPTEAPKAPEPTTAPTEAPKAAEPTATTAPTEAPKAEEPKPTEAPKEAAPVASGDVIEVNVKMSEFKFEVDKASIPAGKTIRFIVDNIGEREHEMVLELTDAVNVPLEANGKLAELREVAGGAKGTIEWVFDKPGKYLLGCHVGRHFERGMKLEIEVT